MYLPEKELLGTVFSTPPFDDTNIGLGIFVKNSSYASLKYGAEGKSLPPV